MKKDASIQKGKTLLDLYTVDSDAYTGGFGRVFRVRHTGWEVDLAMKQPKKELFRSEQQKNVFMDECDNWIRLGLHPHIVSCYYVRKIDNIPSIFAEWMEGGSLRRYIDTKELYRDSQNKLFNNSQEITERILDLSIQFARGLHYAHTKGLIHQDVKPDNLLLSVDIKTNDSQLPDDLNRDVACPVYSAKVADFGIANARSLMADIDKNVHQAHDNTMIGKEKPFSIFYCSPEQMKKENLTLHTDIWSWAASVLEMFTGDRLWMSGSIIGKECEYYFNKTIIPIPEGMKALLRWCFRQNEADRPHDFGIVEAELLNIYRSVTGNDYPRPEPQAASLTADSFNNHALSYLDLGKTEEAEKCWEDAIRTDPNHAISQYNYSLHLWKSARIDDMEALRRLKLVSTKDMNYANCLAKLHLARADAESAMQCINETIAEFGETVDTMAIRSEAQAMIDKGLDGRCIHTLKGHEHSITSVCFNEDNSQAITNSWDGTNLLWDIERGILLRTSKTAASNDHACNISPNGKLKLTFGKDKTIKIWNLKTGVCIRTLTGHTDEINAVCWGMNNRLALSGSTDCTAKIWYIPAKPSYQWILSQIQTFDVSDKERIYLQTMTNQIDRLIVDKNIIAALIKFQELKSCVPQKKYVDVYKKLSTYCIFTLLRGYDLHTIPFISCCAWDVYWKPDKKQMLFGSEDGLLRVWDFETEKYLQTIQAHTKAVRSVCFSVDGKLALSGSNEPAMKMWDIETGDCILTMDADAKHINSVCFSPDGTKAVSVGESVKLWNVTTGECIHTFFGRDSSSGGACFSPDGKYLLASVSNQLIIWDVDKRKSIRSLKTNYCSVFCFSPDGNKLLTNAYFYELEEWDIPKGARRRLGKPIRQTPEEKYSSNTIHSACYSPDGKLILFCCDTTMKLLDVQTGRCIKTWDGLHKEVKKVFFSSDGLTIIAATTQEIHSYDLDFNLHFPGWAPWDEGARPYLKIFLKLNPRWTTEDFFHTLIPELQNRGFGHLQPEGVWKELKRMSGLLFGRWLNPKNHKTQNRKEMMEPFKPAWESEHKNNVGEKPENVELLTEDIIDKLLQTGEDIDLIGKARNANDWLIRLDAYKQMKDYNEDIYNDIQKLVYETDKNLKNTACRLIQLLINDRLAAGLFWNDLARISSKQHIDSYHIDDDSEWRAEVLKHEDSGSGIIFPPYPFTE